MCVSGDSAGVALVLCWLLKLSVSSADGNRRSPREPFDVDGCLRVV